MYVADQLPQRVEVVLQGDDLVDWSVLLDGQVVRF